ncbi:MAG: 4Fe-4S binding protein [Tenericutes bacterium]|nr:4Fe-4S binding protein [Mycoplasmatota bacterium]
MIKNTGIPSLEQIKSKFPDEVPVKPKAIIECYQEIPCNPCATSCPFDAITIGKDINQIPRIDFDKCTGCGSCVYSCPGLAIIIANVKNEEAVFRIPYEQLPLPEVGSIWHGVNRNGEVICKALIKSVLKNKNTDRTCIITVIVPKQFLYEFITIRCPE